MRVLFRARSALRRQKNGREERLKNTEKRNVHSRKANTEMCNVHSRKANTEMCNVRVEVLVVLVGKLRKHPSARRPQPWLTPASLQVLLLCFFDNRAQGRTPLLISLSPELSFVSSSLHQRIEHNQ